MAKKKIEFTLAKNARTLMLRKDGTLYAQLKWNRNMEGDLEQFLGKTIVIPTGKPEFITLVEGFVVETRPCGVVLENWRITK